MTAAMKSRVIGSAIHHGVRNRRRPIAQRWVPTTATNIVGRNDQPSNTRQKPTAVTQLSRVSANVVGTLSFAAS